MTATPARAEPWRPAPGASIQLQYSGEPIDLGVAAEIYNLDLFETGPVLIDRLHQEGRKVICYMSVGTVEDWRPDAAAFPAAVVGQAYPDWPGERWLDLRALDALGPLIKARLDLARDKGCDGIDPDNLDGHETTSGFPLMRADIVAFMRWLSGEARARGLALGLKNGAELWPDLKAQVDWVLIEDCAAQGWCAAVEPAAAAGLAVFQIEYTDEVLDWPEVCKAARARGFSAIRKHRALDAYREDCP
ncbi:MAG: endo alpha-1,4 polygalactosaminidase [Rhodospirillaceae bacterium]|nr:endo alpha-1,4 polygalactosaminidase [Rhodospirillaceae bacterium]